MWVFHEPSTGELVDLPRSLRVSSPVRAQDSPKTSQELSEDEEPPATPKNARRIEKETLGPWAFEFWAGYGTESDKCGVRLGEPGPGILQLSIRWDTLRNYPTSNKSRLLLWPTGQIGGGLRGLKREISRMLLFVDQLTASNVFKKAGPVFQRVLLG